MKSPYEVFLKIAECRSISKAAGELNITQPGLSRQLRRLERDLGAELFERHSGGMRLTVFGESILPHAETIARADQAARLYVQRLRETLKGRVTFGVAVASTLLPSAMFSALHRLKNLHVTIVEDLPVRLCEMVKRNELEFAVCASSRLVVDQSLAEMKLYMNRRGVFARSNHEFFSRRNPDLSALLDYVWILPTTSSVRDWLNAAFEQRDLAPPIPRIETASIEQIVQGVESGKFISVLPESSIRTQLRSGLLRPVFPEMLTAEFSVSAVHRTNHKLSSGARILLDSIAEAERTPSQIGLVKSPGKKIQA